MSKLKTISSVSIKMGGSGQPGNMPIYFSKNGTAKATLLYTDFLKL